MPDVYLNKNNGNYYASVNEEGLPKLRINKYYVKVLKNRRADRQTREFIRKRYYNARWLIEAIGRRRQTIERVCNYLIQAQRDYFDFPESELKSLTLRQVADGLGISQATVSRVCANKYLQASEGIYPLKHFFATSLKQQDAREVSDAFIKGRLKRIIEDEDSRQPLSDAQIVSLLKKEGINVARRTLVKYRKELNILSSSLRK